MSGQGNIDGNTKKILANSKLEISNEVFAQVLMAKVLHIEKRKTKIRQLASLAVLLLGFIMLGVAVVFCVQHVSFTRIPVVSTIIDSSPHLLQATGKWVLVYLKYIEILAAFFVIKAIVESQTEFV